MFMIAPKLMNVSLKKFFGYVRDLTRGRSDYILEGMLDTKKNPQFSMVPFSVIFSLWLRLFQ